MPSVAVDLTDPDGPAELVERSVERFGGLDILVNNVGAVRPRLDGFLAVTDEDWDWTLTINFLAAVRTMRAALPHLVERPGANIVTISSVNAFLPDPAVIDYSAAKAALTNLCKSLSKEFGPQVRVNTISPGPVRTDLWLGDTRRRSDRGPGHRHQRRRRRRSSQAAAAPTGRFTHPTRSPTSSYPGQRPRANITGSDFVIDGGLITTL